MFRMVRGRMILRQDLVEPADIICLQFLEGGGGTKKEKEICLKMDR